MRTHFKTITGPSGTLTLRQNALLFLADLVDGSYSVSVDKASAAPVGVVPWLPSDSQHAARASKLLYDIATFANDFESGIMAQPSKVGGLPGAFRLGYYYCYYY